MIERIEVMVEEIESGGGKGEKIIECRRNLRREIIEMENEERDKFGIGREKEKKERKILIKREDERILRKGMIVVVEGGNWKGKDLKSRGNEEIEMVIVINVEKVVLEIIMILKERMKRKKKLLKKEELRMKLIEREIGIEEKEKKWLRKIVEERKEIIVDKRMKKRKIRERIR